MDDTLLHDTVIQRGAGARFFPHFIVVQVKYVIEHQSEIHIHRDRFFAVLAVALLKIGHKFSQPQRWLHKGLSAPDAPQRLGVQLLCGAGELLPGTDAGGKAVMDVPQRHGLALCAVLVGEDGLVPHLGFDLVPLEADIADGV